MAARRAHASVLLPLEKVSFVDFAPHTERDIETTFIAVYFDAEIIQVVTA